jgi:ribose 5-phosphate isomerase RpiB
LRKEKPLKIAIASDHAGFDSKEVMAPYVSALGHEVHDLGARNKEPSDYRSSLPAGQVSAERGTLCSPAE